MWTTTSTTSLSWVPCALPNASGHWTTFARLRVPLAVHKAVSPIACLTFLGITIDTVANELRLLADKLERLRMLQVCWGDRKTSSQRELESLIGVPNHACKVVCPGLSFLRWILDLLKDSRPRPTRSQPVRFIRLNREFRSDSAGGRHSQSSGMVWQ